MWQRQGSALRVEAVNEPTEPGSVPVFLVELDPWHRGFLRNLSDLLWTPRRPPLRLISWPATPWPDVFVPSRWPWRGLSESAGLHLAVLAALIWAVPLWMRPSLTVSRPAFQKEDVIYYAPSEYLPPLDTGSVHALAAKKADPAHAAQPIISVPAEADNRTQTIVTPTDIKLDRDVPLPNMVAWTPTPVPVPMAATARKTSNLQLPAVDTPVVAPPPDLSKVTSRQPPSLQAPVSPRPEVNLTSQRQMTPLPDAKVVAPPPSLANASKRRLGDINIGPAQVVAPAPKLLVAEQRTLASMSMGSGGGATVVAPPPSTQGAGISSGGGGRVIALSVRPAPPGAAAEIPAGNRRGTFAATPDGKAGASGTPGSPGGKEQGAGDGGGSGQGPGTGKTSGGLPSGLHVGAGPAGASTSAVAGGSAQADPPDHTLVATVTPPKIGPRTSEIPADNASELEKKVFGSRKFYSMTLNMPNFNSAGGSWVIRFAEMKENAEHGDLTAPVATRKVDPAYPLELMRRNVHGTVTLYAVIRSDGSVGEVRVLNGVNDQLDEFARAALAQWRFSPATKNGNPVTLEAVVMIPFRPFRVRQDF